VFSQGGEPVNGFTLALGPALALIAQVLAPALPPQAGEPGCSEQRIRALVRQLGDREFRRREAAQDALLREGMRILPVLDRLGPQDDAEINRRLGALRAQIPPCKLVLSCAQQVRPVHDPLNGKANPCLTGRVSLLAPPGGSKAVADGLLRVRLHDHTPPGAGGRAVLEEWVFPRDIVRRLAEQAGPGGEQGTHVPLVLPWATYRSGIRQVSVTVRYEPAQGAAVECRSAVLTLEPAALPSRDKPAKK
jgi:hypothetical protein